MITWTFDMTARLQELVSDPEQYSETQIACIMTDEFGEEFSRDAVHNKILRLDMRSLINKPITDIMPYFNKYRNIIEGEQEVSKEFHLDPNQMIVNMDGELRILHLGDLHIPFQNDEQVQTAVNRNRAADLAVVIEVADCYSISRFNKNLAVPFQIEIDNVVRYFEYLSETFPLVFVAGGNHEKRVNKTFTRGVPADLLFLVQDNMLKMLARPFENIVVFDTPVIQINDAIFTHAEYFSKVDLKAGVNVYQFLSEWKETLGIQDYNLVVQSHTHMLGATYRQGGNVKVMESGCLCRIPDYAVVNYYGKPQINGYCVVVQRDGKTNFDLTREHSFPTQRYVKSWSPLGDD